MKNLLVLAMAALVACGDAGGESEASGAGSSLDGGAGGGAADATGPDVDTGDPDAALPGDGGATVDLDAPDAPDAPDAQAAPVAPPAELTVVTPTRWMVAVVSPGGDAAGAAIEAGTFTLPEPGLHDGVVWKAVDVGEDGVLINPLPGPVVYAATTLTMDAPTTLVVRAGGTYDVLLDGVRQPGDIYDYGGQRVALRAPAGDSLLILRGAGRGSPVVVELATTPHEILLRAEDLVTPDLIEGASDPQPLGLPAISLVDAPILDVVVRVLETDTLAETTTTLPGLVPLATTHLTALLEPKGPLPPADTPVIATVRVESPSLDQSYELEVTLTTVAATANPIKRTFVSAMDGSAQLYGLRLPAGTPAGPIGLALSLHGAGVGAPGQAAAYSARDWIAVAAATNRRPFGFDWEGWGRRDALEVLDDAMSTLPVDPTRVYLTGHSMGGHGTWQLGTLFPGRFAVVGPSAGWISFATYGGETFPEGPLGWARASSDTPRWAENLAKRAVYIIHGTADDNVPISEAHAMFDLLTPIVPDLQIHEEEGAGHWWDGDAAPGADCVDWPALFETMAQRTLDPTELDFVFHSPSPWVSPTHSYVTVRSVADPSAELVLTSAAQGSTVTLSTSNVRSMTLDGAALRARGVETLIVDGSTHEIPDGPLAVGPTGGKGPGQHGPLNEVLERPWCAIWPDDDPFARRWAAWLVSNWAVLGNGQACGVPLSAATDERLGGRNRVYVLVPAADVPLGALPFGWTDDAVTVHGEAFEACAGEVVFPLGDGLGAAFTATAGSEALLWRLQPFTSRFVAPDLLVWAADGLRKVGFWSGDWGWEPTFVAP